MSLAPETAVGPLAAAPPDRPTRDVESVGREWIALLFRDGGLDMNERKIVFGVFQEIQARAAAAGGIGQGGGPQQAPGAPGPSPMEMNANGQSDMYAQDGAQDMSDQSNQMPPGY